MKGGGIAKIIPIKYVLLPSWNMELLRFLKKREEIV